MNTGDQAQDKSEPAQTSDKTLRKEDTIFGAQISLYLRGKGPRPFEDDVENDADFAEIVKNHPMDEFNHMMAEFDREIETHCLKKGKPPLEDSAARSAAINDIVSQYEKENVEDFFRTEHSIDTLSREYEVIVPAPEEYKIVYQTKPETSDALESRSLKNAKAKFPKLPASAKVFYTLRQTAPKETGPELPPEQYIDRALKLVENNKDMGVTARCKVPNPQFAETGETNTILVKTTFTKYSEACKDAVKGHKGLVPQAEAIEKKGNALLALTPNPDLQWISLPTSHRNCFN
ncbi:MAG: hypothetical protein JWM96_1108 [Alphaproteobacteria bacterium]|nr:hypothetical protein [Alphaproteobacteria bacterium]